MGGSIAVSNNQPIARIATLGSATLLLFLPLPALAQQTADPATSPPPVATEAGNKQVYTPADFVRYAPRNALDMLRQVPGFTIRSGSQERGLGQASENVLLNGQRVANKSGGAVEELEKMAADRVERIEIVDAASLDIAGLSGQVANIVTKPGKKASGQFSWTPRFGNDFADPVFTRGSVSYSSGLGPLDYTLALDSSGFRGGHGGITVIRDPLGGVVEFRDDVSKSREDEVEPSARFTINGPGSSIGNASISYTFDRESSRDVSERLRPDGLARTRFNRSFEKGWEFELGGDFAFDLVGGRLKLIGLLSIEDEPSVSTAITQFADGSPTTGDQVERESRARELIGRAEYGWKWGRSDFQISAEGAFNSLNNFTRLFLLDSAGTFVEIPFPAASGQVKEDRYELLATFGRPLGSGLTLQLVGGAEHSTLEAGGVARKFLRPKGSLLLGWKPDVRTDVSLKLARAVGQLNFNDFLASVSLADEQTNAGNINLVPPQSWEADLEVNRGLGRLGTTRVRLYGRLIEDIVDVIPIGVDGESLGNLDRATRYGVEWKSTFELEPLGWRGAKLDATVQFEHSDLKDPLTGEKRPISSNLYRSFTFDLRHDVPGGPWAWGLHFFHDWRAHSYRLTEVGRRWEGPIWLDAFVENKDVFGLTVRATVTNFANARNRWDRTVFDGRRTDPVLFRELRNRSIGPAFNLSVRGNF